MRHLESDEALYPGLQIFRSIDSDSADGFPASNAEAARLGLDSNKGRVVEFSIQKAYINAIRQVRLYCQCMCEGSCACFAFTSFDNIP